MVLETRKGFVQHPFTVFEYLGYDGGRVIKPDPMRHTTDVAKEVYEAFHQALPVFTLEKLEIAAVTVRKGDVQVMTFMPGAPFIKLGCAKIHLGLPGDMSERHVETAFPVQLQFLFGYITSY